MIRCLVWDLDRTLWDGVLSEGDPVKLRPGVREALKALDQRGVLHSVASKNDHAPAWAKLEELGVADYFVYPEIHWNPKSSSLEGILEALQIQPHQLAFVDDDPVERAEVASRWPEALILGPDQLTPEHPRFPAHSTLGSQRRVMAQRQQVRDSSEREFVGTSTEFLRSLELRLSLFWARPGDLDRAQELIERTTQLNTTGRVYSRAELESSHYRILMARLTDRFGDYGTVGLALLEGSRVRLLLSSCRAMGKGVGGAMLVYLEKTLGQLEIDFIPNERNRMMEIALALSGYQLERESFHRAQATERDYPDYLQVQAP